MENHTSVSSALFRALHLDYHAIRIYAATRRRLFEDAVMIASYIDEGHIEHGHQKFEILRSEVARGQYKSYIGEPFSGIFAPVFP